MYTLKKLSGRGGRDEVWVAVPGQGDREGEGKPRPEPGDLIWVMWAGGMVHRVRVTGTVFDPVMRVYVTELVGYVGGGWWQLAVREVAELVLKRMWSDGVGKGKLLTREEMVAGTKLALPAFKDAVRHTVAAMRHTGMIRLAPDDEEGPRRFRVVRPRPVVAPDFRTEILYEVWRRGKEGECRQKDVRREIARGAAGFVGVWRQLRQEGLIHRDSDTGPFWVDYETGVKAYEQLKTALELLKPEWDPRWDWQWTDDGDGGWTQPPT